MKDIIKVATVSFHTQWGDKASNLKRIIEYIKIAADEGSNLIVFPEMVLTGYDDETEKEKANKMQTLLAELVPGYSSVIIAKLAREFGVYVIFGMPERDENDSSVIYNSACICGPKGIVGTYRKLHLPGNEPNWATRGSKPFILDTEWGSIGIGICYDSYSFQELMRYYAAKGCRIYINCTAFAKDRGLDYATKALEIGCLTNEIFIVSSNLTGIDLYNDFAGGSSVIAPGTEFRTLEYLTGYAFNDKNATLNKMYSTTMDLSLATMKIFSPNEKIDGETDYRPDIYLNMFKDIK